MPLRETLFFQRGNAVITSIILLAMVSAASITAVRRFGDTKESFRMARVRSLMRSVEAQVLARVLDPGAYLGCTGAATGCHVNEAFFADLLRVSMPGAVCPSTLPKCGVSFSISGLNLATKTFHGTVAYEGNEVKPKPIVIAAKVPLEVLQTDVFQCGLLDPERPVFTGFDSAGAPICKGFNSCGLGEYVRQINVNTRTLTCRSLPSNVSCGSQQMIANLQFTGSTLNHACADRPDPEFDNNKAPLIVVGSCSATELLAAKKSMIQISNENIHAVAQNCIDSANPTVQSNLPSTPLKRVRFMNTCGRRWCILKKNFYTGRGVELNADVTIECRQKSPPPSVSSACQQVLEAAPPVFSYNTTVTAVADNCRDSAVPNLEDNKPKDEPTEIRFVNTCGNRFCVSKNFTSGRVVEFFGDAAEVECYDSKNDTGGGTVPSPMESITVAKDPVRDNCVDSAVPKIEDNEPWVDNYRFVNTCGNRYCNKLGFDSGKVVEIATDYSQVVLNCFR